MGMDFNDGKNIKVNQAEFIDRGPLSRGESMFNMEACSVLNGIKSLFEWLAEAYVKMAYRKE